MIVEKLIGTNWGRHKQIVFDCNGSIVGVTGPNGCGKTTVLSLLEFLITGETRDNLDSYVRNYEGNASGEMLFRKNGQVGKIFRQVGASPKRRLEWAGQIITKAADVDKTMAEIFGADKKALANSVFVNQGTLEDVLFKFGADRVKAFIRLVNLSFCESRARMVDTQAARVASMVVDLTPARDEAAAARMTALELMNRKNDELIALPSYELELNHIASLASATTEVGLIRQQIGDTEMQRANKQAELDAKLGGLTLEKIREENNTLATDSSEARTKANTHKSILSDLTHYGRIQGEITQCHKENGEISRSLLDINPNSYTAEKFDEIIKDIDDDLQRHADREALEETTKENKTNRLVLENQLDNLIAPGVTRDALNDILKTIQTKKATVSQLTQWTKLQTKIKACIGKECVSDVACPECGLTLLDAAQLDPEHIQEQVSTLDLLKIEIGELEQSHTDKKAILDQYDKDKNQLDTSIRLYNDAIQRDTTKRDAIVVAKGKPALTIEKRDWTTTKQRAFELQTNQKSLMTSLSQKLQSLAHYPLGKEHWKNRASYSVAGNKLLSDSAEALEKRHTTSTQQLTLINGIVLHLQIIDASLVEQKKEEARLSELLSSPAPGVLNERLERVGGNMNQVESEMKAAEQYRSELKGAHGEAVTNYQTTNTRFQDLETRIAQNQVKIELLRDLHKLRDLLSDSGIPLAFVKHKFDRLAFHTQEGLLKMNSNFYINIDPERDLEFNFHRLDEMTKVDLPMAKLSGGQRVRLCLAFLMALQKTLIKDVGLLVLDEPTVHVDTAGVDQIVEFLGSMRQELKNTEHQIWIVDHNPKISAALELELVLK